MERRDAGIPRHEELYDVYPDAAGALTRLRAAEVRVGMVGNQPSGAESSLSSWVGETDFVATSADWGVAKPDPAFFERLVQEVGLPADSIAYAVCK